MKLQAKSETVGDKCGWRLFVRLEAAREAEG